MGSGFAKGAISTSLIAVVIIVLVIGMLGAFYLGQNSVKIIGGTEEITTTETLQTIQTIQTTQTILTTQTLATTQSSTSNLGGNVKTVTLSSATLYGGVTASTGTIATSSITLSLNNPSSATTITGVTLTGAGITTVTQWSTTSTSGVSGGVNFGQGYTAGSPNAMGPGSVTSFTFYPWSSNSQSILTGQTFNYVITFANGQSVSGSLIAQ